MSRAPAISLRLLSVQRPPSRAVLSVGLGAVAFGVATVGLPLVASFVLSSLYDLLAMTAVVVVAVIALLFGLGRIGQAVWVPLSAVALAVVLDLLTRPNLIGRQIRPQ